MDPGILLMVNGHPMRLKMISVALPTAHSLPVWTVEVDTALGCGGTLEAAILIAARAADTGTFPIEEKH